MKLYYSNKYLIVLQYIADDDQRISHKNLVRLFWFYVLPRKLECNALSKLVIDMKLGQTREFYIASIPTVKFICNCFLCYKLISQAHKLHLSKVCNSFSHVTMKIIHLKWFTSTTSEQPSFLCYGHISLLDLSPSIIYNGIRNCSQKSMWWRNWCCVSSHILLWDFRLFWYLKLGKQ